MGYAVGDDKEVINANEFSFMSQECLLVYPFVGAFNVKKASFGLPLCDTGDDCTCSQVITNQLEKTVGQNGCHATVYAMKLPNTFLHHNSTPNLWKERGVYTMCLDG